jgi:hypothetical protein
LDLATRAQLALVHQHSLVGGIVESRPVWSPDGSMLLTSAMPRYLLVGEGDQREVVPLSQSGVANGDVYINIDDSEPYVGGFDLVVVNKSGVISRLSHLTTRFVAREDGWTWAPDGTKVAFLLSLDADVTGPFHLVVLDVLTGVVTDLCVEAYGSPYWSPDSSKLAFNASTTSLPWTDVYVADLSSGNMSKIAEDANVVGWMEGTK